MCSFGVILGLLFSSIYFALFQVDFNEDNLFTLHWHLYLSLIFICGLSEMNISDLELCMLCSTAGISGLKTFVLLFESHTFFCCLLENAGGLLLALLESGA